MVRTYIKKTNQGSWCPEKIKEAIMKVKSKEMTIRQAAEIYDVPYTTLQRRVISSECIIKRRGGQPMMDKESEKKLADRLVHLTSRGFHITPKNVRKYAFDFVSHHNLKHNFNLEKKMAGEDWFYRFMERNKNVTIRKSESLLRARMNGIEKDKVVDFYKTLQKVIDNNNLQGRPECIYKQDKTKLPLNNHPPNVIAVKQCEDGVSMISVEQGENVTVLTCMNAAEQFIPPFFLSKNVSRRDDFMISMPSGTEIAITEKGWVTEEAFKLWLEHFNRYRTKGKVILILDSHSLHANLAIADFCESLEIELLLIPPHISHAFQPLDVSFFKPLITYQQQATT